jgi:ribonucleoside-diphosphate reductase alpha chain
MREPDRARLPDTRQSVTRRIEHNQHLDIYVIVGFFEGGSAGEVFVKLGKEGSTLQGLTDGIAVMMSLMLQYGIPWERIGRKVRFTNFDPLNKDGHSVLHAIVESVDEIIKERTPLDGPTQEQQ